MTTAGRSRWMWILLGLTVTGVVLDQVYRRAYEQPRKRLETQLSQLQDKLQKGKRSLMLQKRRLPQVETVDTRSLPRDTEWSVSEYRNWVLRLLATCKLQQASLDAGAPAVYQKNFHRIDFSLRTRGTLPQLTEFLQRFYATDYLHKIRSISLTPMSDGMIDASIMIETLSSKSAASTEELADRFDPQRPSLSNAYEQIAQRNLFRAGESLAAKVTVTAITRDARNERCAWLSFPDESPTRIVSVGDKLTVDGSHVEVLQVAADTVEIDLDGQRRQVRIGQTLR